MENSLLKNLSKFLDTPEGKKSVKEFSEKIKKENKRKRSTNKIIMSLSQEEFEQKLNKLILKHDKEYKDKKWKTGCIPYPNNLLELVFDVAYKYGRFVKTPLSDLEKHFYSEQFKYRNFYFALTQGQGTVQSIYDKDKKLIFRT